MRVAVNPPLGSMGTDQMLGVGDEARIQQRTGKSRVDAARRRRVMRDDNRRPCMGHVQRAVEPGGVALKQLCRVVRHEERIRCLAQALAQSNAAEVAHQALRLDDCGGAFGAVAEQPEVGPQRAAEKAHAVDDDGVVVQHMDLGAFAKLLHFCSGDIDAAAVELVVAQHVDDGLFQPQRPLRRLARRCNVACQYDHVSVVQRCVERAESNVQVRQDVEFHGAVLS